MAEELREVLPVGSANQLEPSADQAKENDQEKESRYELLAATSLFNAASSDSSEEQREAEDALREAMSSPSKMGAPDRRVPQTSASACLPDFTQCPEGWAKKGSSCVASASYGGQCAHEVDLSEWGVEQKLAFASFCAVSFPCQGDCSQDFQQSCPSLWREIGSGVCSAPLQYEGDCASRLETAGMSEEDKYGWSVRCGARWPCAASQKNSAKLFAEQSSCARDHGASCPLGWHQSGTECSAPVGDNLCGNRKDFRGMTPAAKADWAHNCKAAWPCK